MSDGYTGDVTASECWSELSQGSDTFLIDVRTAAEWSYVGIPSLRPIGKAPILAEWQSFPSMQVDRDFAGKVAAQIEAAGGSASSKLYFLCRSGARSMASARAMSARGFTHCYNVIDGFEGPADPENHRGRVAGWKAEGLPWVQN